MALPPRLWIPDGTSELPTALLGPTGAAVRTGGAGGSGATPVQRLRRRALWRGEAGLPDRPVLVEWFPASELERERAVARRVSGLCHVHLLRLLDIGTADPRNAYAVSEAPDGVDLFTVLRAAPGELPLWWGVAVAAAVARALGALEKHAELHRRRAQGHGRVNLGTIFVGWDGSVRLLAFSSSGGSGSAGNHQEDFLAPELRLSQRLLTSASDVYALGALLRELWPPAALRRPPLSRLLQRCLHIHADQRIGLLTLRAALEDLLLELPAPLTRASGLGDVLGQCCPRATVDLMDADWGESTGDGYPALPPTLLPLSPRSVPLSPTWLHAAPPQRRARFSLLDLLVPTAVGLLALALLFLWAPAGSSLPPPLPGSSDPVPDSVPALPSAVEKKPPPAAPPLRVRTAASPWPALRLSVERMLRQPERLSIVLQLGNTGRQPISPDLSQLRLLVSADATDGLSPIAAPQITVGPGRKQQVRLDFALLAPPESPTPEILGWRRSPALDVPK